MKKTAGSNDSNFGCLEITNRRRRRNLKKKERELWLKRERASQAVRQASLVPTVVGRLMASVKKAFRVDGIFAGL